MPKSQPLLTHWLYAAEVIEVVDYDPNWPARFEALRQEYGAALAPGTRMVGVDSWRFEQPNHRQGRSTPTSLEPRT